ncbi:DUF6083 domain-containing protein [Streptomyces mutabilis]|uniref:DUF6083 domain-containing protein n=1 Tax=Streptomyces TaxID=1883 RepID=UPI00368449BC
MQCKPDVRRAYTGRHVLLEPDGLIPAPLVPPGHRWRVDSDGIAWNPALDEPAPGTACRVPHLIACSGRSLDEIQLWAWLQVVRAANALAGEHQRSLPGAC